MQFSGYRFQPYLTQTIDFSGRKIGFFNEGTQFNELDAVAAWVALNDVHGPREFSYQDLANLIGGNKNNIPRYLAAYKQTTDTNQLKALLKQRHPSLTDNVIEEAFHEYKKNANE